MTTNTKDRDGDLIVRGIELEDISKNGVQSESDENTKRGNWGSKLDFILSCLGFAVGLGNVWRFPYLCYANGGGAFLIPYIVCLALAGLPMFYFELALGQFASLGCISVWKLCPIFKGLGYGMLIVTALVCVYYNVIIAWTIFYLFASFSNLPGLPWVGCDNWWNTDLCADDITMNGTNITSLMMRQNGTNITHIPIRATQEYWDWLVLRRSADINESGSIVWQLALCLLLAWVVVFLCIAKGVKSSGKVVYVTATFPYVILVILLIRGVTLPGSLDGILFYIKPRWNLLLNAKVWKDAATQIFYSLGVAFGGLHTLGSYNRFHNNCYADALIVALCNCGTSVFAGFVIFSVIGFMAYDSGEAVADVVQSGQGLAFVAYPEAISRLPISPLWAILFFLMLFTLGLDSQFVMMETVVTAAMDELSETFRKRKTLITCIFCAIWCCFGLPCVLNSGVYWLTLFDWYSASFALIIIAILECVVVSIFYGINQFSRDIKTMLGYEPNIFWKACWVFISPFILLCVLIFSFYEYAPVNYAGEAFPIWADLLGWLMVLIALAPLPIYAIRISLKEGFFKAFKPTSTWGPALDKHRLEAGYPLLNSVNTGPGQEAKYLAGAYQGPSMTGYINTGFKTGETNPYPAKPGNVNVGTSMGD